MDTSKTGADTPVMDAAQAMTASRKWFSTLSSNARVRMGTELAQVGRLPGHEGRMMTPDPTWVDYYFSVITDIQILSFWEGYFKLN